MKPETKIVALPLEIHRESLALTKVVVSPASDPITIWMLVGSPVAFEHRNHTYIGTILEETRKEVQAITGTDLVSQLESGAHSWRSRYAFHEQLEQLLEDKIGAGNDMRLVDVNDPEHEAVFPSFPFRIDPNRPVS